jgi:hypothetical protein
MPCWYQEYVERWLDSIFFLYSWLRCVLCLELRWIWAWKYVCIYLVFWWGSELVWPPCIAWFAACKCLPRSPHAMPGHVPWRGRMPGVLLNGREKISIIKERSSCVFVCSLRPSGVILNAAFTYSRDASITVFFWNISWTLDCACYVGDIVYGLWFA